MNLVPNMGPKGGFFKKSSGTLPEVDSMLSRTQMNFGLGDTRSKFGQTTTNLSKFLGSDRELNSNTVPLRVGDSRQTERLNIVNPSSI